MKNCFDVEMKAVDLLRPIRRIIGQSGNQPMAKNTPDE